MNAIPASSAATRTAPLPNPTAPDLLGAMRPAMDTAFAVGRPTDATGAAKILGTGGSYLQGAAATLGKLDEGIAKRRQEIAELKLSDPDAAKDKQTQLDLLERLRDRIQLSIERVSDILAGKDREDIGNPRREHLELLEQRRQLLAPAGADAVGAAGAGGAAPAAVAGAYASAGATTTS